MGSTSSVHKEKNNKIHVCADFSTGLNKCLESHNPLPSPEEIFANLNVEKSFRSWIFLKLICK